MKLEKKQTILLIGLSVLLFRLLGFLFSTGWMNMLTLIPWPAVLNVAMTLRSFVPVITCGLSVYLAVVIARKTPIPHTALLVAVWLFALQPFRIYLHQELVFYPPTPVEPSTVQPITLSARIIDGELIGDEAFLRNTHVSRAEAFHLFDDVYNVKLHLTREGRDIIRDVTERYVDKRIGFFLDGDLKASPQILQPIESSFIIMPLRTHETEAHRIAAAIMKNQSQQEAGGYRR